MSYMVPPGIGEIFDWWLRRRIGMNGPDWLKLEWEWTETLSPHGYLCSSSEPDLIAATKSKLRTASDIGIGESGRSGGSVSSNCQ